MRISRGVLWCAILAIVIGVCAAWYPHRNDEDPLASMKADGMYAWRRAISYPLKFLNAGKEQELKKAYAQYCDPKIVPQETVSTRVDIAQTGFLDINRLLLTAENETDGPLAYLIGQGLTKSLQDGTWPDTTLFQEMASTLTYGDKDQLAWFEENFGHGRDRLSRLFKALEDAHTDPQFYNTSITLDGEEYQITSLDMALYRIYEDVASSEGSKKEKQAALANTLAYAAAIDDFFLGIFKVRADSSALDQQKLEKLTAMNISGLVSALSVSEMRWRGQIISVLGLKAWNEANNLDLWVAFERCGAELYLDRNALYYMALLNYYDSDAFEQQTGITVTDAVPKDLEKAYYWLAALMIVDEIENGSLASAQTQMGWSAVAMLDTLQNTGALTQEQIASAEQKALAFVQTKYPEAVSSSMSNDTHSMQAITGALEQAAHPGGADGTPLSSEQPTPPDGFTNYGCEQKQEVEVCTAGYNGAVYSTIDGWKTMRKHVNAPDGFTNFGCEWQDTTFVCQATHGSKAYETSDDWKTMREIDIAVIAPKPAPVVMTNVPAGVHARVEYYGDPIPAKYCNGYEARLVVSTDKWPEKVLPIDSCVWEQDQYFRLEVSPGGNLLAFWYAGAGEGTTGFRLFNLSDNTVILSDDYKIKIPGAPPNTIATPLGPGNGNLSPIVWLPHQDGFVIGTFTYNQNGYGFGINEQGIFMWVSMNPKEMTPVATLSYDPKEYKQFENLHENSTGTAIEYSIVTRDFTTGNITEQIDKSFPI